MVPGMGLIAATLLALGAAGGAPTAPPQNFAAAAKPAPPNPYGDQVAATIHSTVLNEDRPIQIFLPKDYVPSGRKYDVLYVLDGEMLGRFVPPVRAFAEENELVPPLIIVSVPNVYWYDNGTDSRERDLLPAHVAGSPLSGGADTFIRFLRTELIPFIDTRYATNGRNTLFGHSYAGMFTVYAFLQHPELFHSYIASDPALWWNDGYVDRLAVDRLRKFPTLEKTLFIGTRSGRMSSAFGVDRLTEALRTNAPANLRWKSVANADEDHGSVRLKNIYDGLKFSYFGHSPSMIDFFPREGILLANRPIALMNYSTFTGEQPGIRYTTDGTDPTIRSPRFDWGTAVRAPAVVTVKQFSNWGPDKSVRGRFRVGAPFPATALPGGFGPGGFAYSCVAGSFSDWPSDAPKPFVSGRTDERFRVSGLGDGHPFSCRVAGAFKADHDGYYIFFLNADHIASLRINGRKLMRVGDGEEHSFVVPLKRGFHPVELQYFHDQGDRSLTLTYLPFDEHDTLARLPIPIPVQYQYGQDPAPTGTSQVDAGDGLSRFRPIHDISG